MDTTDDRRVTHPSFRLLGDLAAEVLVPMGRGHDERDHLALAVTIVGVGDNTVTVDAADGAAALRIAIAQHSVLVWGPEGEEQCALVRSGRRVDDVHSPTTIELVIEDVRPLAELAPAGAVEEAPGDDPDPSQAASVAG